MSGATDLLADSFGRIRDDVGALLASVDGPMLTQRMSPRSNTIGWLVWHLLRVQDDHVADAAGTEQVLLTNGWLEKFSLPFGPLATGYGQSAHDVAAVQIEPELLLGYSADVHAATLEFISTVNDDDLDRIVDERWDPPVSLAVRLVSVIGDDLKHLGQAEYLEGVLRES